MSALSQILGDMSVMFKKTTAYTHNGSFTADNVLCGALCKLLNPDLKIYRTVEEPPIKNVNNTIYYDFNSNDESITIHNAALNIERRADGVRYGTFGLLWRDYGPLAIIPWDQQKEVRDIVDFMVDDFDENIIEPMDIANEKGTIHPWVQMLINYNYLPNEKKNYTANTEAVMYDRALTVGIEFLQRWCEVYKMRCKSMAHIYNSYNPNGPMNGIIYIDDKTEIDTSWALEFVREHIDGIYYVIRPSSYKGYNVYTIKKTKYQLEKEYPGRDWDKIGIAVYKRPFPKSWYGKGPEDLKNYYDTLFYAANDGSMITCEEYNDAANIAMQLMFAYTNTGRRAIEDFTPGDNTDDPENENQGGDNTTYDNIQLIDNSSDESISSTQNNTITFNFDSDEYIQYIGINSSGSGAAWRVDPDLNYLTVEIVKSGTYYLTGTVHNLYIEIAPNLGNVSIHLNNIHIDNHRSTSELPFIVNGYGTILYLHIDTDSKNYLVTHTESNNPLFYDNDTSINLSGAGEFTKIYMN